MNDSDIQAPKPTKAKPIQQPQQTNEVLASSSQDTVIINEPKPKRKISEKQKEILAQGRANLKAKKEQQLAETAKLKDEAILKRAEQIKKHKDNIYKQIGVNIDEDSPEEPRYAPKKPAGKIVKYYEYEDDEAPKPRKKKRLLLNVVHLMMN